MVLTYPKTWCSCQINWEIGAAETIWGYITVDNDFGIMMDDQVGPNNHELADTAFGKWIVSVVGGAITEHPCPVITAQHPAVI